MTRFVALDAGPLNLLLCPVAGGAVARFRHGSTDIFRGPSEAALAGTEARALACYPMIPYSNRIPHGRFEWNRRQRQIRPNSPVSPHPLHGNAWQLPWRVAEAESRRAVLVLDYDGGDPGAWPFPYRATQIFALDEAGLTVTMAIENTGRSLWPAGMGLHPYWPLTPDTLLAANLPAVWLADAEHLPLGKAGVPARWDFTRGRPVAAAKVDHCFAGWDGRARLAWPDRGVSVAIEADAVFGHFVVAAPLSPVHFACEPATHCHNAINFARDGRKDTGLVVLAPGASLSGTIRFAVTVREP